jgi:hypothetical protein
MKKLLPSKRSKGDDSGFGLGLGVENCVIGNMTTIKCGCSSLDFIHQTSEFMTFQPLPVY